MNEPTAVTPAPSLSSATLEIVLGSGDLSRLTPQQRVEYYGAVCRSLGVNPLTRPFDFLRGEDGKIHLYPNATCAAQLRDRDGITITETRAEHLPELGVYQVHVRGRSASGREDAAIGVVPVVDKDGQPLRGRALANALMKADTIARRRLTLALAGLGWSDAEAVEDSGLGVAVPVNTDGQLVADPPPTLADRLQHAADALAPTNAGASLEAAVGDAPAALPTPGWRTFGAAKRALVDLGVDPREIEGWLADIAGDVPPAQWSDDTKRAVQQRLVAAWQALQPPADGLPF